MAKFKVVFEREVIQTDRLMRIIEAETEEQAREQAEYFASEFNMDCPDDITTDDEVQFESWEEREIELAMPHEIKAIPEASSEDFLAEQQEAAR